MQPTIQDILGREAFQGGVATALLGGVLHVFIAFVIVAVYFLASRRAPLLTRHTVPLDMLYGIGVYFVMSYIVIPLSAANQGSFSLPVFLNGILIHALGVGLPAALFARAATRAST
jgi:hypothetical protein